MYVHKHSITRMCTNIQSHVTKFYPCYIFLFLTSTRIQSHFSEFFYFILLLVFQELEATIYRYPSVLYHNKVHPADNHTRSVVVRIWYPLLYSVLLRSGVDKPLPQTSRCKHDLSPTPRDASSNVPVTSLIDVNIFGNNNSPNT